MTPAELSAKYPRVYHMAASGSWPSIEKHGLLSTTALLDIFEITGAARDSIERQRRPNSVQVRHPVHGHAVIRDQKPMDDRGLIRALGGKLEPSEWYRYLNQRTFFWVTKQRLATLLGAQAYRDQRQLVLTVDTSALLSAHHRRVLLTGMNTGATRPMPHPRGLESFVPLAGWPPPRGRGVVVELTVERSVPDIRDLTVRVDEVAAGGIVRTLVRRAGEPSPF